MHEVYNNIPTIPLLGMWHPEAASQVMKDIKLSTTFLQNHKWGYWIFLREKNCQKD